MSDTLTLTFFLAAPVSLSRGMGLEVHVDVINNYAFCIHSYIILDNDSFDTYCCLYKRDRRGPHMYHCSVSTVFKYMDTVVAVEVCDLPASWNFLKIPWKTILIELKAC